MTPRTELEALMQERNRKALADWRLRRQLGIACIDAWSPMRRAYLDMRLRDKRLIARLFVVTTQKHRNRRALNVTFIELRQRRAAR